MNTPNFELIGHMLGDYHDLQSDGIVDAANRFPLGVVEEQIRLLELFEPAGNATLAKRIVELERENAGLAAERDTFAIRLEDSEEQYSELHNKNSALAAQVEALQSKNFELTCYRVDVLRCLKTIAFEHNHADVPLYQPMARQLMDSISANAELKEVRAEAGRDGFVAGYSKGWNDFDGVDGFRREPLANQYADSIRRGEVE